MTRLPKWFTEEPSTRERSKKQERSIAKQLQGHTTINSGATFGQNDVVSDSFEVEAKTTKRNSYTLKYEDWKKASDKTEVGKIPVFAINYEVPSKQVAVLHWDDFLYLINKAGL